MYYLNKYNKLLLKLFATDLLSTNYSKTTSVVFDVNVNAYPLNKFYR